MRVLLLDKEKITKINLPEEVEGVFLMPYIPVDFKIQKELSIEARDGKWILKSNGSMNVMDKNSFLDELELADNTHAKINIVGREEVLDLYCVPTYDQSKMNVSVSSTQITIGSNSQCSLIYGAPDVKDVHAGFYNQDGVWYVSVPENVPGCYTYLNDQVVKGRAMLRMGDIIFLCGLKIVWMGSFMQLSNPENRVTVNTRVMTLYTMEKYDNSVFNPVSEEEQGVELYRPEDYFFHTPNLNEHIENYKITIDDPPDSPIKDDNGMFTMSISLTMLASSFVSGFNLINNILEGVSWKKILPTGLTFTAMILGSLLIPRIVAAYNKKQLVKREKYRVARYTAYLNEKSEEIFKEMQHQTQVLLTNNRSIVDCLSALGGDNSSIWIREIKNPDFLRVRLGLGSTDADIEIEAPKERFTLKDDELYEKIHSIVNTSRKLENVPITFSFLENKISAVVCNCSYSQFFINTLITQLAIYHSAADLKMVFLTNKDTGFDLSYAKHFPHVFSADKQIRFYSENSDEMKIIASHLEKIYSERRDKIFKQNQDQKELVVEEKTVQEGYRKFDTYYLIITDDFMTAKSLSVVDSVLNSEDNYGFSFLILDTSMRRLPNQCKAFVNVNETEGRKLEKDLNSQTLFTPEFSSSIDLKRVGARLLNVPLMELDEQSALPQSLTFLEMYNVSKIEQLNIVNRWKTNDPTISLSTPIGVHTSGETFTIDLHEKMHGPHGLIAGSTGSGKSEFIITFVLSMCVNFHPDEVQFVLIDYKGGGLAGAFENRETKKAIPHIAGTITNLDAGAINRSIVSINSELKRRQRMFNESKTITGESTIDIYKYQRYYREGIVKEPISHLFIVSDEFAELKAQQPEFMDELVSTARIGRSLGVHLILATQKPSGVVNEQIWSNSKFKICLKVANRGDSMEMLKRPEAASIKETGRFYLQVGYDEYFDIGQSGWSGAKYIPTDKIIKKKDDSIIFVNNTGGVIKTANNLIKRETNVEMGDQLTNIVKTLMDIAEKDKFVAKKLWLDNIPEFVYIGNLKSKYNYTAEPYYINPIIGEYDNPEQQKQGLLTLDLMNKGNTIIYGASNNGQDNLLSTIIYSSAIEHTPEEINFYVVDLGAEVLKIFKKLPHVGDVCTLDDAEKITNVFIMLDEELDRRKELFSDYNGEYSYYIKKSGQKLPLICCIINNYDAFTESFAKMSGMLESFYRDCSKYGICFITTCSTQSTIRGKVSEYFTNKLCLRMAKDEDYRNILNSKKGLVPAKFKGRGIALTDDGSFEFQSAYIYLPEQINDTITNTAKVFSEKYTTKAKRVPMLPEVVTPDLLYDDPTDLSSVPVGYNVNTREPHNYDFSKEKINIITAMSYDDLTKFTYALTNVFAKVPGLNVKVFDFTKSLDLLNVGGVAASNDLDNEVIRMYNEVVKSNEGTDKYLYYIVGIDKIKESIKPENHELFTKLMKAAKTFNNVSFVICDEYDYVKKLQLETWYVTQVDKSLGIWIGPNVGAQSAIAFKNMAMEVRKLEFSDMAFVSDKNGVVPIRKVVSEVSEVE